MRIQASGVTLSVRGRRVLDAVDFSLRRGELVGLIGPNGAGKTTLLRVLANLIPVEAGEVTYDGARGEALGRELARKVAFLAQAGEVNWALSVERLVGLGRLPHRRFGLPTPSDALAVERALAAADATALRGREVSTLSGGERSRVLLARALAVEAPVLLADEPVTALDPYHQLQVMELLRAEGDAGKGIVAVLHDLSLAHRFCDRLVLLDRGRVRADDVPDAVLSDSRVAAAYRVRLLRSAVPEGRFVLPWARLPEGSEPEVPGKGRQ